MDDSTAHAFGRVEAKIDKVFDQVGSLSQRVAEYGVRLTYLESAVAEAPAYDRRLVHLEAEIQGAKEELDEAKAAAAEVRKQRFGLREKLGVAAVTLVGSGVVSWVVELLKN